MKGRQAALESHPLELAFTPSLPRIRRESGVSGVATSPRLYCVSICCSFLFAAVLWAVVWCCHWIVVFCYAVLCLNTVLQVVAVVLCCVYFCGSPCCGVLLRLMLFWSVSRCNCVGVCVVFRPGVLFCVVFVLWQWQ